MKIRKNIKITAIFTLTLIIVISLFLYVKNNGYVFLYINPNTNTDIYPYISKSSKEINKLLFKAAELLQISIPGTKILYTNGYGSGYIKNNIASSDYDYNAGIFIGTYQYDGNNSQKIAKDLLNAVALYQANIYSLVKKEKTDFYIQRLTSERIYGISDSPESEAQLMAKSIQQAMIGKPYKLDVEGRVFMMDPDEIVIPNYKFIKLYNKDISYYKDYRKMLRELTVTIDYFCNIVDTKTNKVHPIEIVASVGDGLRIYQPEFKYFVPNAYTDIKSFNYVRKIIPQMNDEDYIETIFNNYFHHYKLYSYGNGQTSGTVLKTTKRLIQCTDIIAPILPNDAVVKIREFANSIISNPTIAELNDYYIANSVLYNITKASSLYKELEKNKEVSTHINNMEQILSDMIDDPQLSYNELKPLFEYQSALTKAKSNITDLQHVMQQSSYKTNKYVANLMYNKISNAGKVTEYAQYLNKVLEVGGLYNIKFYQNTPDHLYVLKDNFTKRLNPNEISKLDIVNGSRTHIYNTKTKIEFKEPKDFYGDPQDLEYGWIRYNTNKQQDALYKEMTKQLLKDRKNHHPRIWIGITR